MRGNGVQPSRLARIEREIDDELLPAVSLLVTKTMAAVHRIGSALNEAKRLVPYGQWGAWIDMRHIPERNAQNWMRVAREYSARELEQVGTVDRAIKLLTTDGAAESAEMPAAQEAENRPISRGFRTHPGAVQGALEPVSEPVSEPSSAPSESRTSEPADPKPKAPTLRERCDDLAEELKASKREVMSVRRQLEDAERRNSLLQDDARPDAAARLQELANVQQENTTLVTQLQHWLFPASVCFQTAPRRVAVARQEKMPRSARVVR